jgi:uncharacterized protein (UPF0218 family)
LSTTTHEETALVKAVQAAQLTASTRDELLNAFGPHFTQMLTLTDQASAITVTDETQTAAMKAARTARLAIKKVRTETESTRKQVKEDALRFGKAVDNVAGMIKAECESVEKRLEECETFAERAESKRAEVRRGERLAALQPFGTDTRFLPDLGVMSETDWFALLERERESWSAREHVKERAAAAATKAEEERIEMLKKQAAEITRLRADAEQEKAKAKEEQARIDAANRAEREKIDAERREATALMQKVRDAQAQAEIEERTKAVAIQEERDREAIAAQLAADAPDAAKLRELAERVRTFEFPAVGERAVGAIVRVRTSFVKTAEWLDQQAATLEGGVL